MGSTPTKETTDFLAFAAGHVNASVARPIDPATLAAIIDGQAVPAEFHGHARAFFDETDVEMLSDLVRSGAATYAGLAAGASRFLPPGHDTRVWLDERT